MGALAIALKVFPVEFETSAWLHAKIAREADLASRLNDPGICAVHDSGVIEGHPFLAMRFVEGVTLRAWLADDPSLDQRLALLEHAARVVHRAHEVGVVHRDLKPANLMVQGGQPVILDFGSAGETEGETGRGGRRFEGSAAYAAPEEIEARCGAPDRRSDVFSLGVVAYEVLTSERPFQGNSVASVFQAILQHEPPSARQRNPAISRDLAAVLHTALEKEQDARYQTALDLAEDLGRVRRHEPVSVCRAGLWTRYQRWLQRRPRVAGGVTLAVLLLAVGTGLSGRLLQENRRALAATRRYSDLRALPDLVRRERENRWPRMARGLPAMDAWLAEADALLARRDAYAAAGDAETLAFLRELDALRGIVASVRERRRGAATLAARTIDAFSEDWAAVCAAIADVEANPIYGGLRIGPQEGLVPLGQDPHSRLFEFGHPQSGGVPVRNPWSQELSVNHASGFVFVLVPAGAFRMGAVPPGPGNPIGAPNVDPDAQPDEAPVHTVPLDAFFLSKYEASELQWQRIGGQLTAARTPGPGNHPRHATGNYCVSNWGATRSSSVGSLSWDEIMGKLSRFGLILPTEAQMEYATRAGTSSVWSTGNDYGDVRARENVPPSSVVRVFDGAPNPFGFFQLHGNNYELALDGFGSYELPFRSGDGLRLVEGARYHAIRGGHPNLGDEEKTRSAARHWGAWAGFRPARALEDSSAAPPGVPPFRPAAPTPLFEAPVRIEDSGEPIDTQGYAAPARLDFDGDGCLDLLVGDRWGFLRVFRNVGSDAEPRYDGFEWLQAGGRRARLPVGCCVGSVPQVVDLDGDGVLDILCGSYWPGDLWLLRGDGRGGFREPRVLLDDRGRAVHAGGDWPSADEPDMESLAAIPFAADLDADGDLDLLIGNLLGYVVFVRNDGTRAQADYSRRKERLRTGGAVLRVDGSAAPCVVDWDGDGLPDLLVGDGEGSVWFFRNSGERARPTFSGGIELLKAVRRDRWLGEPIVGHGDRVRVCATDYDGDGDLDLLLGDYLLQRRPEGPLTAEELRRREELRILREIRTHLPVLPEEEFDGWLRIEQAYASLAFGGTFHGSVWLYRRIDTPAR